MITQPSCLGLLRQHVLYASRQYLFATQQLNGMNYGFQQLAQKWRVRDGQWLKLLPVCSLTSW